jgi:hypothetical protein
MPDQAWGVVDLALITAALGGAIWLVAHLADVLERGDRVARLMKGGKTPPPAPVGMPIERIAADLRRIRPEAQMPIAGTPMVRRLAVVAAYDQALLEACRALDIPTDLDRVSDALERESERLRTEAELERAGVDLG